MGKKYEDKQFQAICLMKDIDQKFIELYNLLYEFINWPGKSFDVTYLKHNFKFNPCFDEDDKKIQDRNIKKLLSMMLRDACRFMVKTLDDITEKGDDQRAKAWYPLTGFFNGLDPEDLELEWVQKNGTYSLAENEKYGNSRPLDVDSYQVKVETTPEDEEDRLIKELEEKYGKGADV